MGLFKKTKSEKLELRKKAVSHFKEAVKEIDELYDDVKSEYEAIESLAEEFETFIEEIKGRIGPDDMETFNRLALRLNRLNSFARNSVRDVRDVLRNQKKRLREIQNGL